MIDRLRRVRIARVSSDALAWCEGMDVSLPEPLFERGLDRGLDARGELTLPAALGDAGPFARALRIHAAFTPEPPVSARLPVSYRMVPGVVRRGLARALGRRQRQRVGEWAAFPGWPLDLSADLLADLATPPDTRQTPSTPVVLTHDLDSPEGLRNLVSRFLPVEERVGARSTNYVVPRAWKLDHGLLKNAQERGHELGIHGFDHSNRTAFAAPAERRERLAAGRELADRYEMAGYRAPSLLRTRELVADLETLYRYDSSIPTSGGLFPVPNNGCASARPFRLGRLLEIPVSLPRDGSLQFLGYDPAEILEVWKTCADRIARARGVVVLLTHCEDHFSGRAPMLDIYSAFLQWLAADGRFTWRLPSQMDAPAADA